MNNVMRHYSTAYYVFEGIKENLVHYRCRKCHQHLMIELDAPIRHICPMRPAVAADTGAAAGAGYVHQD